MSTSVSTINDEIFSIISELSRSLRCCQQESAFCENVTFTQFFILESVAKNRTLRLRTLHHILSVEKSTTTRLLEPLVKQGLIIKDRSETDSRAINLSLTKRGESVRKKVWDCLSGFFDTIRSYIPEEKRADVFEATKIFIGAMQNACSTGQSNM